MAGDWIKLEHATIDKAEVGRFAEILCIKSDEALGILLRFWVWLDRNADRNGCVTHVTPLSLDATLRVPGFTAALGVVGWAEIDDRNATLTVPHFERHNGNSAKTRSSNAERQQRYREKRNASVTQNVTPDRNATVTREEKRREEITTKPLCRETANAAPTNEKPTTETEQQPATHGSNGLINGRKRSEPRGSRLPPDWRIPEELIAWTLDAYPDADRARVVRLSLEFRDYWSGVPGERGRKVDWAGTWRNNARKRLEG